MKTILGQDLVLVLTDKGLVASYDDVNMLFWDQKCPKTILAELSKKFRAQQIHVLDQRVVPFEDVDFEIEQYLSKLPGVEVSYVLDHVNPREKSGKFRFKTNGPNANWKSVLVSVSNLLIHKIKQRDMTGLVPGDHFIGTTFTSTLHDTSFSVNPFKLVEFIPGRDSDIPHNYRLELVYETLAQRFERVYPSGKKEVFYKFQKLDPSNYRRYECHVVNKRLKDCRDSLVIVPAK